LGKAIVAFQPKELVERLLRISGLFRRTEKTVVNRAAVLADLEEVSRRGYALDREESVMGGICFGAPILDERQRSVAAISVSIPLIRVSKEREQETIKAVVDAARQASAAIQAAFPASRFEDKRAE
jgi:DNA-binding IclR family transcriptional regulator